MALIDKLNTIGDAVRERSGYTEKLTLDEMAIMVKAIPYPEVEEIKITENGIYEPAAGIDGFNKVIVETVGSVDIPSGEEVEF